MSGRRRWRRKWMGGPSNGEWKAALFGGRPTLPCFYCGHQIAECEATVDHVIPRAAGGRHHRNRVLACFDCNQEKGSQSLASFLTPIRKTAT